MTDVPFWIVAGVSALLLGLALTGCAGESGPEDSDLKSSTKNYRAIVITYGGRPLHCIERKGSTGLDTTSGSYSGLSCDWVAYHEEG